MRASGVRFPGKLSGWKPRLRGLPGKVAACAALFLIAASPAPSPSPSPAVIVHGPPTTLAGLPVTKEDISKSLKQNDRPLWVDHVGLYSIRESDQLLEATLELSQFKSDAPWRDGNFQLTIAGGLGNTAPVEMQVGGVTVYYTTLKGLQIITWFKDGYMLTLAIRNQYSRPKAMIREALQINP